MSLLSVKMTKIWERWVGSFCWLGHPMEDSKCLSTLWCDTIKRFVYVTVRPWVQGILLHNKRRAVKFWRNKLRKIHILILGLKKEDSQIYFKLTLGKSTYKSNLKYLFLVPKKKKKMKRKKGTNSLMPFHLYYIYLKGIVGECDKK